MLQDQFDYHSLNNQPLLVVVRVVVPVEHRCQILHADGNFHGRIVQLHIIVHGAAQLFFGNILLNRVPEQPRIQAAEVIQRRVCLGLGLSGVGLLGILNAVVNPRAVTADAQVGGSRTDRHLGSPCIAVNHRGRLRAVVGVVALDLGFRQINLIHLVAGAGLCHGVNRSVLAERTGLEINQRAGLCVDIPSGCGTAFAVFPADGGRGQRIGLAALYR